MVDLADVHRAKVACWRAGHQPAAFRCHTDVAYGLVQAALAMGSAPPWAGPATVLGMALVEDDGLEPGAWRLLDEFDTLLYDCRMGALP